MTQGGSVEKVAEMTQGGSIEKVAEMTQGRSVEERLAQVEAELRLAKLEAELAAQRGQVLPVDPKEPANFAGDKVGAGRYVLSFLMAGFFGLWIAYWARYYGWRCIWITGGISVAIVVVALAASG